jgi:hypothetical protein
MHRSSTKNISGFHEFEQNSIITSRAIRQNVFGLRVTVARERLQSNASSYESSAKTNTSKGDGDIWNNVRMHESSGSRLSEARGKPGGIIDIECICRNEMAAFVKHKYTTRRSEIKFLRTLSWLSTRRLYCSL